MISKLHEFPTILVLKLEQAPRCAHKQGFPSHCRAQTLADEKEGLGKHLNLSTFQSWAKRMPAVATTLRSLLAAVSRPLSGESAELDGGSTTGSSTGHLPQALPARLPQALVPQLIPLAGVSVESCLMRPVWAWALATSGCLPLARCQEWRLLFSSAKHGQSFSTFMGRC